MADPPTGHDEAELAAIARHALHDEELVAAYAADDIENAAERERARTMVDRCATCRDIHRDVALIRIATRASGTAVQRAATLSAPHDFRLTAEDATRLRPGSPIARVERRFGWRARLDVGIAAFGRPVGAAMATFGVVGLLVGSLALGGGPGSLFSAQSAGGATSAPGAEGISPGATQIVDRTNFGPQATAQDAKSPVPVSGGRDSGDRANAPVALLGGSIALLVVGIGLFLAARRRLPTVERP